MPLSVQDNPRKFFEDFVKKSYQEWLKDPLSVYRAKICVSQSDIMAERMFKFFEIKSPNLLYGAKNISTYRNALADNECHDFQIIWNLHDAHKHVVLTLNKKRLLSNDNQSGIVYIGFGMGGFGESALGGGDEIIVELDDGSQRTLSSIISNVICIWERLLMDAGL